MIDELILNKLQLIILMILAMTFIAEERDHFIADRFVEKKIHSEQHERQEKIRLPGPLFPNPSC